MPIRFRDIFRRGEDQEEAAGPLDRPTESIRRPRPGMDSEKTEVLRRVRKTEEPPEPVPEEPPPPSRPPSGRRRPVPLGGSTGIAREVSEALEEILADRGAPEAAEKEGGEDDWEISLDEVLERYSDEETEEKSPEHSTTEILSEDQVRSLRGILADEEGESDAE
jgi:hypothetical protein